MKYGEFEITVKDLQDLLLTLWTEAKRVSVPKNRKNLIGVVVAIKTEGEKEKVRLTNDFVNEINDYLHHSKLDIKFNVIQFDENWCKEIKNDEVAKQLLEKSGSHFMIWGGLTQRQIDGEPNYIFKLRGLVRHSPVSDVISNTFTKEFSEVLPSKPMVFPESQEALGFETTQHFVGLIIKYVVGIAAMVSGDLETAFRLFDELNKELGSRKASLKETETLVADRIPARLIDINVLMMLRANYVYVKTRNPEWILSANPYLETLKKLAPDRYDAHLMRAMLLFFSGNVDGAINELKGLREADPVWRYSLGFLLAYSGKINEALEQYKKTFYSETEGSVLNEIEVFIGEIIERHPEMDQLIFFRGLLNYKSRRDFLLAKIDFQKFLDSPTANKYPNLVELANHYLAK